ncbi:BgTH12-03145 [Blumeria graminis f. sp. triticale]|uniref:Bgt-1588 n=3 Tax=Blumeria graminis TaxID=34373 RepID=A0A061HI56_BLUGR|nr:hypothetical protein BGT96224_1588 [Blumeria graminis f. sp. tritici 96224]CAD6503482.1 BgTH12-03145 [Blumeria graminis f. sp. triticale]VDB89578.1 Bgt-1588 [Blumeria graminis f. sp. tritici]
MANAILLPKISYFKTPRSKSSLSLNPNSRIHEYISLCQGFQGWKYCNTKEDLTSKSFSNLKDLGRKRDWNVECDTVEVVSSRAEEHITLVTSDDYEYQPGTSPIEMLPLEILRTIIQYLTTDIPLDSFTPKNTNLLSLLLTSRVMYSATVNELYSCVTISQSRIFQSFFVHLTNHPSLGALVKRLDFSSFNPTGAGMTARERAETLYLIPETLNRCLELTPQLQEFLAQEHIHDDLDSKVIERLFCHHPRLKALDFTACSSPKFCEAFTSLVKSDPSPVLATISVTRLCLHECTSLTASVYSFIIPKMPQLTHLDVSHTQITDSALHSIAETAQITHLNISRCTHLTGASVVDFILNHIAVKNLVYLNLAVDPKSHEMFDHDELTLLLSRLPKTLRSLNLKGSRMTPFHVPFLLPLSKHLEEIGLGRYLSLSDIIRILLPDKTLIAIDQISWNPHTLRYIDISDLSGVQLDLITLFSMSCPLLKRMTEPLEVIEINAEVQKRILGSKSSLQRFGWTINETGNRIWMMRENIDKVTDTGERMWKWGARNWGMRKIPVARAEARGFYKYWMFKYAK